MILRTGHTTSSVDAIPFRDLAQGARVSLRFTNGLTVQGHVRAAHEQWMVLWHYPATIWVEDIAELTMEGQ
jgi:hypothetical protein